MPELPDVEQFRRLVDRHGLSRVIAGADVTDPASLKAISPAALDEHVRNRTLRACRRHGKVLLIEVDAAGTLAMHFGTNGSLQYVARGETEPAFVRLWLDLAGGDRLAYLNPRRIGHVQWAPDTDAFLAEAGLGRDALDPSFDATALTAMLRGRKQAIKTALMDQALVAGIGNIFADEILFQARLHPSVKAGALDAGARRCLLHEIRRVLQTAIDCGAGAENFDDRLPKGFLLAQRRVGGHCPRCGASIQTEKHDGRVSYFCPRCQPPPRA